MIVDLRSFKSFVLTDPIFQFGINFAGSRAVDSPTFFTRTPYWDDATKIMGQSAMGSTDAMIVNFFICSKFPILVTADDQIAHYTEDALLPSRIIVVPHEDELG